MTTRLNWQASVFSPPSVSSLCSCRVQSKSVAFAQLQVQTLWWAYNRARHLQQTMAWYQSSEVFLSTVFLWQTPHTFSLCQGPSGVCWRNGWLGRRTSWCHESSICSSCSRHLRVAFSYFQCQLIWGWTHLMQASPPFYGCSLEGSDLGSDSSNGCWKWSWLFEILRCWQFW